MKKTNDTLKAIVQSIVGMVIIGFIAFYVLLPPLNIQSPDTWVLTFILLIFGLVLFKTFTIGKSSPANDKILKIWLIGLVIIVVLFVAALLFGSKIFRSRDYANIIEPNITTDSFDNYKATMETVPLLDKQSAMLIANRKMGSLEDVVSQFEIY
ncbi:MAG TPA: hypothetical protein VFC79_02555, partial [Tissierellaceae bacterium]|nr:hypothetical protein [Tissierellaceae bacterium]